MLSHCLGRQAYHRVSAANAMPAQLTMHVSQGAIHFEEGVAGPDRVQRVLSLYKRAVAPQATKALSDADREQRSARSVTFADTNADAATAEQTAAAHALLVRSLSSEAAAAAAESKKRPADAGAAGAALVFLQCSWYTT